MAKIAEGPKLLYSYSWLVFQETNTERLPRGLGIGPIPVSAIRRKAREDGLSPSETELLVQVVRRLDSHHLEITARQQERAKDPKKAGSTVNGRMIDTSLL